MMMMSMLVQKWRRDDDVLFAFFVVAVKMTMMTMSGPVYAFSGWTWAFVWLSMDQPLHLQLENAIVCVLTVYSFVLNRIQGKTAIVWIFNIGHHGKYNVTKMYLFRIFRISYLRMTIVGLLLRFGISLCPTWRERHVAVVITHDQSINEYQLERG